VAFPVTRKVGCGLSRLYSWESRNSDSLALVLRVIVKTIWAGSRFGSLIHPNVRTEVLQINGSLSLFADSSTARIV
jgi:hypothetical protein